MLATLGLLHVMKWMFGCLFLRVIAGEFAAALLQRYSLFFWQELHALYINSSPRRTGINYFYSSILLYLIHG